MTQADDSHPSDSQPPVSDTQSSSSSSSSLLGGKSKLGAIGIAVLVLVYSVAAPQLNERFGLNLPAIRTDADGNLQVEKDHSPWANVSDSTAETSPKRQTPVPEAAVSRSESQENSSAGPSRPQPTSAGQPNTSLTSSSPRGPPRDAALLHGMLREVAPDRYLSPEGLLYTPGSAEGHRLKHVARHTKDIPGRPAKHGVFDGQMPGALKTIDLAYQRAQKNQRTTKKTENGRVIYTVDMGQRVGYVGGSEGNRRRKPMARRVRIVLDGNRVITAFPL